MRGTRSDSILTNILNSWHAFNDDVNAVFFVVQKFAFKVSSLLIYVGYSYQDISNVMCHVSELNELHFG